MNQVFTWFAFNYLLINKETARRIWI